MINYNVDPYNDDFDPTKNYHRILFKPGYAVQARELTQSQTILQNQISQFASAIYSQNTPVSGGKVTTNLNCSYIKLNSLYNGSSVVAYNFLNTTITDSTGTIIARVIATAEATGNATTAGDPPTLIVTYTSGGQFTDGMTIYIQTSTSKTSAATTIGTSGGTTCTGLSSVASISDGVFYVVNGYDQIIEANGTTVPYTIGNFVNVSAQTVILDKYDNTPSLRIGLEIAELTITSSQDTSLLDPAAGASNYQAPGADRYQINLTLVTLPLTLGNDDQFIELLRITNGSIVKQTDTTVYSTIDDYFAKRDYETNGDYIVNDFTLTPSANSLGINASYDLGIGPGVAYVHGYRIENQSQTTLTSDRARTINTINNNAAFVDYGNFFVVDTMSGVFDVGTMPSVDLHCVPSTGIVSTNTATYNSTLVGTGLIRDLTYVTGTGSNTKSYIYNAFVSDISTRTISGATASATPSTLTVTDTTALLSATANAYYGIVLTVTTGALVDKRNIIGYTVSGSTKVFTVDNPFTLTPTSSSTWQLGFAVNDIDSIVQTISSSNFTLTANTNINAAEGKVNGVPIGSTIYNTTAYPELLFQIGYPYVAQVANTSYFSTRIYRGKTFTGSTLTLVSTSGNSSNPLRFEGTGTLSAAAAMQNFIVINTSTGNVLDFTSAGNTVSVSADHTTATFTSAAYSGMTVDVIAVVQVQNADSTNYVLKSKNLVLGNTAYVASSFASISGSTTTYNATSGQTLIPHATIVSNSNGGKMPLYVNDVRNIVKIIDSGNPSTNPTGLVGSYADITNNFTFDNGQRDSYYDFGYISLLPGAPIPTGNILVVYNYYSHTQASSGDGYFSLQSYQSANSTYGGVSTSPENYAKIAQYTSKGGTIYRLTDVVDFRPCRKNGQTGYLWEYSQTQTSTNDIGILLPNNLSNFTSNYSYYLGRQDRLVLTKDKSFQIVEGTPSVSPSLPAQPDGSLLIANLLLDPYTAFVPGEGPAGQTSNLSVNKVLHKRWAKSDITDLETRVNNLEYYTSLNILEQNAQSLQVADVNGLNRFKNGILVDDFSSFATADTGNPDYAANINVRKNEMTALSFVDNFQLQNPAVMASLGTLTNTNTYAINSIQGTQTNIFTLPYTTANVVVQSLASSTVSANPFAVVIQQGVAQLNPPMDNWVDNSQAPAILITDPSMQVYQQTGGVNLINSSDFQTIPGTQSTISSSTQVVGHGINASPYGYVGYTATTTSTYGSQIQNVTSSAYNPVSSTFGTNNGYITNIAILPYIRPQEVIVQAEGLLVNTKVSTWFDGTSVDQYMRAPNTIELTGVTGKFNKDDVVGFYLDNFFYPIARVINVYNYPNGTQARLYVADILGAPNTVGTTTLTNGTFNSAGDYVVGSSTASGTVPAGAISNLYQSGEISGVGGGYSNTFNANITTQLYMTPVTQGYCSFLNQYGVWGDPNNSTTYNAAFPVPLTTGATYTIALSCSGSASVTQNGTTLVSSSSSTTVSTATFTAASSSPTIAWNATSSGTTQSAIAVTITDSSGNIVFSSVSPPELNYINGGTEINMYLGGAFFEGVTQVYLGPQSSSATNYYVGSTISITSKYVYGLTAAATYVPPPPAPTGGGGGGCGGCFTANTLVTMADGTTKSICDVKVGDKVKNYNGTKVNTVQYIEYLPDTLLKALYTPTPDFAPFATVNHPLYIGDVLSKVDQDIDYPWLKIKGTINPFAVQEATGQMVYNLWLDGDHTYIVNGFGTTSIIDDGGMLRKGVEQGVLTHEEAMNLVVRYASEGRDVMYGSYLFIKLFGKINSKTLNKVMAKYLKNDDHPTAQSVVKGIFKVVGKIANLVA